MTANEVYDKFFADEEYDLEKCTVVAYSYWSGWNSALKRASIVVRDEIRPQGEWIIVKDEKWGDNVKCPFCGKELAGTDLNFCCKCGADMRKPNYLKEQLVGNSDRSDRKEEE